MDRTARVAAARRKQIVRQLLDGQMMSASNYGSDDLEFDINVWIRCLGGSNVRVQVEQYDKADAGQYHAEPARTFEKQFDDIEAALEWLGTQGIGWTELHVIEPPKA